MRADSRTMFKVIIVKDELGKTVVVLRPGEGLVGEPGVRFRLALETDSRAEAVCAAELIQRRLQAERRPGPEEVWQRMECQALANHAAHRRTSRARRPS